MRICLIFVLCLSAVSSSLAGSLSDDPFAGAWESSYGHLYFTYRTSTAEIPSDETGRGIRAAFWSYPDSHGVADNGRILGMIKVLCLDKPIDNLPYAVFIVTHLCEQIP